MNWLNDATRAAFMIVVTNGLALAILFGVDLSGEQVAGITSFVNTSLILLMLFVKSGQGKAPPTTDQVVGEDAPQAAARKKTE